jgi:DNA integrity scanning protein DisA with diadenylate cyclase activity
MPLPPVAARLRRLAEELEENGLPTFGTDAYRSMLLEEVDHALRPPVHERRIASGGTILDPSSDSTMWEDRTQLSIMRKSLELPLDAVRRFADGISSWLVRNSDGTAEWMVFDRPAGSERDLVVLAEVLDATVVQRHRSGVVRIVGAFGVLRSSSFQWHFEPPVSSWIDAVTTCAKHGDPLVLEAMLEFAVHDLGSLGIGSLLIYRPHDDPGPLVEERLPLPPPLRIMKAAHLAPLRHALSQIDGAAIFDGDGVLRRLGVRLVPSNAAEESVEPLGGTRHTSARRYSFDDPFATVIAISEDGPVSVLRNGEVLARSPTENPSRSE